VKKARAAARKITQSAPSALKRGPMTPSWPLPVATTIAQP
jgi:hypothetical protein